MSTLAIRGSASPFAYPKAMAPLFMIAIMLFLMAFQFMGTGILAEVIVRTYFETQDKTVYTIASRTGFD